MALIHKDRVKETSTTTGTGTYTLAGAVADFQAFSVIGNANTCYYTAFEAGAGWEVGIGTYTAVGTTLARTTILRSTNADAAVSWGAGTRTIFVGIPADKFVGKDDLLAYLLTIDGPGSGLDADLLDGSSSAAFEPADATILKDADIGVSVQAQDAELAAIACVAVKQTSRQHAISANLFIRSLLLRKVYDCYSSIICSARPH